MKLGKGSHELGKAVARKDNVRVSKEAPVRGLLVMLGTCVAFLAFLVLITVVIHFVML